MSGRSTPQDAAPYKVLLQHLAQRAPSRSTAPIHSIDATERRQHRFAFAAISILAGTLLVANTQAADPLPMELQQMIVASQNSPAPSRVNCPDGWTRTGCSGGIGGTSQRDTPARPIGENGCQQLAPAGRPANIFAHCVRLAPSLKFDRIFANDFEVVAP